MTVQVKINHAHLFCGLGGGAKGFNQASARVKEMVAVSRCLGGIDIDEAGLRDFRNLAGVPGTALDMFSRDQFKAFHGREPGDDWREATPDDVRRAYHNEHPHVLFMSAPCKGFSGLLSETQSATAKYQALNGLTLRGIWLTLEAYKDDPIELIIFENVPRIATRGRYLLDQILALMKSYGYIARETQHDCGELGGLGQSRKRFLLVARYLPKVPNFLYEPLKLRLRGVGEILENLPLPLSGFGGPMHRMPALQWKTWVRLAFVEAGSDWRSLNKLRVEGGTLSDFGIAPEYGFRGTLGVTPWDEPANTITSRSMPTTGAHAVADPRFEGQPRRATFGVKDWQESSGLIAGESFPTNGAYSVADPRVDGHPKSVQLGVRGWDQPAGVVTGKMFAGGGPNSVADPRLSGKRYSHLYRIVRWSEPTPAVTSANGGTAAAVADPRATPHAHYTQTKYRVTAFDEPAGTVIAASTTGNGAFAVADPRPAVAAGNDFKALRVTDWNDPAGAITTQRSPGSSAQSVADPRPSFTRDGRSQYVTAGQYGVIPWDEPTNAIAGHGQHDNGRNSVADPRSIIFPASKEEQEVIAMPAAAERVVCVIRALDGTWHRPFTTFELAALQSLIDPEEMLELDGLSDSAWRERIGNAVPPKSAKAIAEVMFRTLLLAWSGETFSLSNEPVWVRPVTAALMAAEDTNTEAIT